jgi:hypothetical protein
LWRNLGTCATPRWGVLNTNVERRWRKMRSRVSVVSSLIICSMFVQSMNALAGSMDLSAWTGSSSYPLGNDVDIYVEWEVTDPSPIFPSKCSVELEIHHKFSTWAEFYSAYVVPGQSPVGDFNVYCNGADGGADYDWPSGSASKSTYYVTAIVLVESPQGDVDDWTNSNEFELT